MDVGREKGIQLTDEEDQNIIGAVKKQHWYRDTAEVESTELSAKRMIQTPGPSAYLGRRKKCFRAS